MTEPLPETTPSAERRVLRHWHEAILDGRLVNLVKDAIRVFLRSLHRRLTLHDFQLGHLTFLRIVRRQDGLTQRELSDRAGLMDPANVIA